MDYINQFQNQQYLLNQVIVKLVKHKNISFLHLFVLTRILLYNNYKIMNKTTVNEKAIQARQIALSSNYQNIQRIIKDVHTILQIHDNFYPSSTERTGIYGRINLLSLNGHIKINHPSKKRTCLIKIKILFPKDYPKSKPFITAENPNQQIHDRNTFYEKNNIARYDRGSDDNKMHLYLDFPEIKAWGINSDIIKVISEIQRRFNDNFPWIPKEHLKDYGTKQTYNQSNIHPALKKEVQKVEMEMAELESDFDVLNNTRKEMIVRLASAETALQQMKIKQSEFKKNTSYFTEVHNRVDVLQLQQSTIEKFLRLTPQNQKVLQLSSEKQGLQQCLNYLKQQLKQGVKLCEIRDGLKKVYEDMFVNQVYLNQL